MRSFLTSKIWFYCRGSRKNNVKKSAIMPVYSEIYDSEPRCIKNSRNSIISHYATRSFKKLNHDHWEDDSNSCTHRGYESQPSSREAASDRDENSKFANGFGKVVHASGNVYIGHFKDGLRHGYGKLIYADGRIEVGYFEKGNLVTQDHDESIVSLKSYLMLTSIESENDFEAKPDSLSDISKSQNIEDESHRKKELIINRLKSLNIMINVFNIENFKQSRIAKNKIR